VQGQTLGSELIWVLFLNKHGKKIKIYHHDSLNILEIILITQLLGSKVRMVRGKTGINQTKGGESVFLERGYLAVRGVQTGH